MKLYVLIAIELGLTIGFIMSDECEGLARNFPKVVEKVRLLYRILNLCPRSLKDRRLSSEQNHVGSSPTGDTEVMASECEGFARWSTKPEEQARLL